MIRVLGLGLVFVAVQIAGNAGVPPDKAGLAGALITASFQVGVALGLAVLAARRTAAENRGGRHARRGERQPARGLRRQGDDVSGLSPDQLAAEVWPPAS